MLAEQLVLDTVSGADVTFKLIKSSENGTTRIDVATTAAAPALMQVKHSVQGRGTDAVDRHLVQFSRTVVDTAGKPFVITVNLTLAVPRNVAVTNAIVKDVVANLVDFLADGAIASLATTTNLDAILRGES
jgi:hypothetical protein